MKKDDVFVEAQNVFKDDAYNHPLAHAMNGGSSGPESDTSEARFKSREKGEQIQRDLGREAMSRETILAGPVRINANPVSLMDHPAPVGRIEPAPQPEHDQAGQLMLPEIASPDETETLMNA